MLKLVPRFELGRFDVVAIGSSTGGPGHVETILAGLPADLPFPILVAQHLPANFTETFANHLDLKSPLTVVHAEDGIAAHPGVVYVGRGRQHIRIKRSAAGGARIEISPDPVELLYKPALDELFASCAKAFGRKALAVVLSGMGQDGVVGAKALRDAGGMVLTQTAHTCAVYGMPRSCDEAGLSNASLDSPDIRRAILQLSPQHRAMAAV